MDEVERQLWCKAWRMLVQHGDDALSVIHAEMRLSLQQGDQQGVADWRQLADAVEELGK
jgi:hypothetical protein